MIDPKSQGVSAEKLIEAVSRAASNTKTPVEIKLKYHTIENGTERITKIKLIKN